MSDANKYINTYVDYAMGMIHEQTSNILQLKTHLKIATEILPEKEALIASLQQQLEECKNTSAGLSKSVEEATNVKASYEAIKNKVSHMDALTGQLNEVKQALQTKNNEIEVIKNENEQLKVSLSEKEAIIEELSKLVPPPKKSINKKKITEVESVPVVVPVVPVEDAQPKEENDDF